MGIFGTIMNKIFQHGQAAVHPTASPVQPPASPTPTAAPTPARAAAPSPAAAQEASAAPSQSVDVGAVLEQMAAAKGGGNYQTSIVDLLKLLDMDSSLAARKALAGELNVHVGADGTAEENIALHRAVMQKLAENGGKVPDSLSH